MSLSKKHFRAIATILRDTHAPKRTREALADYFHSDNPRFSYDRFYAATKRPKRKKTEMGMSLAW